MINPREAARELKLPAAASSHHFLALPSLLQGSTQLSGLPLFALPLHQISTLSLAMRNGKTCPHDRLADTACVLSNVRRPPLLRSSCLPSIVTARLPHHSSLLPPVFNRYAYTPQRVRNYSQHALISCHRDSCRMLSCSVSKAMAATASSDTMTLMLRVATLLPRRLITIALLHASLRLGTLRDQSLIGWLAHRSSAGFMYLGIVVPPAQG